MRHVNIFHICPSLFHSVVSFLSTICNLLICLRRKKVRGNVLNFFNTTTIQSMQCSAIRCCYDCLAAWSCCRKWRRWNLHTRKVQHALGRNASAAQPALHLQIQLQSWIGGWKKAMEATVSWQENVISGSEAKVIGGSCFQGSQLTCSEGLNCNDIGFLNQKLESMQASMTRMRTWIF